MGASHQQYDAIILADVDFIEVWACKEVAKARKSVVKCIVFIVNND
ncbi:hypothetical protein [Chryseobacterium nepalense]|uniref:Uncharacterized protein n=1 Tax=Chryseobacterium nepalense TaxID=1854498 RepID=A0ABY4K4U3_9FLAO|nr:hypothetical protein [Chryseobacterium nepalense]UPQ74380.1 hypothetical protein M0D58_09990 [Chryseobacterium nepalense]